MLLNTILRSKAHQEVVMKKLKIKPKSLKWNLFGERGRIGRAKIHSLKAMKNLYKKTKKKPIEGGKSLSLGFQK